MSKPRILFSIPTRHHVEIAIDEMEGLRALGYTCDQFFYGAKEGMSSKRARLLTIFKNAQNLIKTARLFKPDIIYLNSRLELLAGMRDSVTIALFRASYRSKVIFLIKSHGSDMEIFKSKSIAVNKFMLPFLKKSVSAWLFLSTEERNTIIQAGYLPAGKVFTTKNIVRNSQFKADNNFRIQYQIPSDHKILLFVGRLIKQKGIYEVINAFIIIRELHDTTLIIVGDGAEFKNIKKLARLLGIDKQIIFTGFVPEQDTMPFYANSDLLLFPTYFPEGFPMALFNAIAAGLCVVTTPIRAAIDFLSEPENCLWVEPKNSIDVADKVNKLLRSTPLMRTMSAFNIAKGDLFTQQQVCAELSEIIVKITHHAVD
jgi:glycosyltransferase involved in cell wall biosynthesis